jgi:hypothetical protein
VSVEVAAMDPLGPPACLLCGERFVAEGYSDRFAPTLLGAPVKGFAPALSVSDRFVGFVCPECFGNSSEDLARSMQRGAERLRELAWKLEA